MTSSELRAAIYIAERTQLKGGKLLAEVLSPVEIEQIVHNALTAAENVRRSADPWDAVDVARGEFRKAKGYQ